MRVTLRLDYTTKKWDLYVGGKLVAADLGLTQNSQTAIGSFTLTGQAAAPTLMDEFLAAFDNPIFVDADKDGMDDAWEVSHGLIAAANDRNGDLDGDGITNIQEYLLDTNPNTADSDGDGLSDTQERSLGTNPTSADSDGDGLPDGWEQQHGLNPLSATDAVLDSDGDGISNLAEYRAGSDPQDYYNGVLPQLTSTVGSDGALAPDGSIGLMVRDAAGHALVNAPVSFQVKEGAHHLSTAPGGPPVDQLTVRTDANGLAKVYVLGGAQP